MTDKIFPQQQYFSAEDCQTLYPLGTPYGNDHPNGWQDMADRLNALLASRLREVAVVVPERIAELRAEYAGKCSPHRHHCKRGDWAWMTLDILELLDAIESAQKEIADLKLGGVVVPELTLEWCDEIWRSAPRGVHVAESLRWCIAQDRARLRTVPADRVLGEGKVAVDREELHQLRGLESCARAVMAYDGLLGTEERNRLKRLDAIRAQPTQAPANGIRHVHV